MSDWKWIEGYEGLYKIYQNGDVERYYKNGNTLIKKTGFDGGSYKFVCLSKNDKKKNHSIHRLLAIYFIDNPNNNPCVDHIDRNNQNNSLENLRWCSYSINNRNRKNMGKFMKGVTKRGKKFVAQIWINGTSVHLGTFDTELEAHDCFMASYNTIMNLH
tara:strand:- start:673 stop:1149 length:477 start_codon:yes stop_codon:yes gene_type:complete